MKPTLFEFLSDLRQKLADGKDGHQVVKMITGMMTVRHKLANSVKTPEHNGTFWTFLGDKRTLEIRNHLDEYKMSFIQILSLQVDWKHNGAGS